MQIKAAVTRAPHAPQSLETLQLAEPRDNEILVRVVATGVCHTDIAMRDQMYPVPQPIVLGHEGAGYVERVGKGVTKVVPGDAVVMTFNSCGVCENCYDHAANYCHDFFGRNFGGSRADGTSPIMRGAEQIHGNFFGQSSFANYCICNERNVVKVRQDAPIERLGPLACGIQTGAGAVINALQVKAGKSFAVFGAGSVGLSAVMAARVVGAATVIAVDLQESRLVLAKELGATHTINPSEKDPVAEIMRITATGVHHSLDTTGIPSVVRQAVESLTPRGECGILGASSVGSEVTLDLGHLMAAGRRIRGIVEGDSTPETFIPQLIELHMQGRFPYDRLLKFYDIDQINDAFHDSESGAVIKPILRMSHSQ